MELIQWWFDKWINSRCHRWVPMSGFEWLFLLRDSFQWAFLLLNCGLAMIFIEWVDSLLFSTSSSCGKVAKSGLFHSKNDPPCDTLSSWCLLNYLIESLAMIMSTLPAAYLLDFIHLLIIFFFELLTKFDQYLAGQMLWLLSVRGSPFPPVSNVDFIGRFLFISGFFMIGWMLRVFRTKLL